MDVRCYGEMATGRRHWRSGTAFPDVRSIVTCSEKMIEQSKLPSLIVPPSVSFPTLLLISAS